MARKELSRKPKRRGHVYCSPFCGSGCSWESYLDAKEKAKLLAHALGKGFKPHVWENMGWHYNAISARAHVAVYPGHVTKGGRIGFWATTTDHGDLSQHHVVALTPRIALRMLRNMLRATALAANARADLADRSLAS